MTSWRTAWRNLTRQITCPACGTKQQPAKSCANEKCGVAIEELKSPLSGLRFHDLRHHAITELAESQASDSTIMAIAGHVSTKMLQQLGGVTVVGPLLTGLDKPVQIASMSATATDIVNLAVIAAYDINR